MPPIALPVMSAKFLEFMNLPPAPSDPPTRRDVIHAHILIARVTRGFLDGLEVTPDDVLNAKQYDYRIYAAYDAHERAEALQETIRQALQTPRPPMLQPLPDEVTALKEKVKILTAELEHLKDDVKGLRDAAAHARRD